MKICFVHRHYPPEGRGGICTYVATLARGLAQAGLTVHVIARAETGSDRIEKDGGVTVHRLAPLSNNAAINKILTGTGHLIRKATGTFINRLWASRRIAKKIEELNDRKEIDLIEAAEWEAELLWYLRHIKDRVPTVVKLHGPMEIIREVNRMKRDPAFECLSRWEKEQTQAADFLSSPSIHLAEEMARRWDLPLEKIEILPYPIDTTQFSPDPNPSKPESPTLLSVGRLEKNKGTDILFQAIPTLLEAHPRARFRIIGADTPTGEGGGSFQLQLLDSLPEAYRSRVELTGPKGHEELIEEYRRASLFVIPSLFDNFPNTCLEAMACGTAVVGSDTGGIREMLNGGECGRLFPPGDADHLAVALIQLLNEPNRIEEFEKGARVRVMAEYALERVVEKTVGYYERIIGANRS